MVCCWSRWKTDDRGNAFCQVKKQVKSHPAWAVVVAQLVRAVASISRGPQFESSLRQNLCCTFVSCQMYVLKRRKITGFFKKRDSPGFFCFVIWRNRREFGIGCPSCFDTLGELFWNKITNKKLQIFDFKCCCCCFYSDAIFKRISVETFKSFIFLVIFALRLF